MSKKTVNVVIIFSVIVILIVGIILLKPNSIKKQSEFKLPFASMSDLAIRDFNNLDYSEDEVRIKVFLTEFMQFITEEYKYTKDSEAPIKKRYNSYFTQSAVGAADNYEYQSEYSSDANAVFMRALFTDVVGITGMKTEGDATVKVISKNSEKLKFVNEEGNRYCVLYMGDISRNKKISEDGIFMNYGGERILLKTYIEFEIYEYLNEFKIHNIIQRSSAEEIKAFEEYFNDNQSELYSFDEMLAKINYSKETGEIKKYINDEAKSINIKALEEFGEDDIRRIVRSNMAEVTVINNLGKNGEVNGIGSGFFIKPGILLTNWHVIDGAEQLKILTYDGKECEIDGIVCANDKIDLAIIKLKEEVGKGVSFASLEDVTNSSPVVAIGHPLGNLYTVTAGIYDKNIVNQDVSFVQSQLPLLPGNSGGPLLDKYGNVIGINTAITAGNTTLSLPYKYIDNILQALEKYDFSEIEVYNY